MKISVLVFWGIFCSISGFEFEDAGENGVTWGGMSGGVQLVLVDESNTIERIKVAVITGVLGTIKADVNILQDLIDVQLENDPENSQNYFLVANRLDYEALSSITSVTVDVIEDEDILNKKSLSINIQNLDDESPTLSVSSCEMPENTFIGVEDSTCMFQVADRDGWLNLMDFSDIEGKVESDLFEFQYLTLPDETEKLANVFLVLKSGQELDYEKKTLYTFNVNPKDNAGHETSPSSIPIIVQVTDVADQTPRWDSSFQSVISIKEEEPKTISVSATDGDVGINNNITYSVDDSSGFVTIDNKTGLISVEKFDRDVGDGSRDQITFDVTATEVEEPTSFLTGTITLLVEDIDDNVARLTVDTTDIQVDEGSSDLGVSINASDIDTGENAIYNVFLRNIVPDDIASAISVIPTRGYESSSLSLTILDPTKLDYEQWPVITMELWTQGTKNESMTDSLSITITLNDLNDELPVFDQTEYTATVKENVEQGYKITNIKATDADKEDQDNGVIHELIGTQVNNDFKIEGFGGDITTIRNNAFDYEKQTEVIIQIRATDLKNHWQTAQLTIEVQDVNDEKPRLLVDSALEILENQKAVIPSNITASDDDSNPYLEFSIDWTQSYATKNSRRVADEIFQNYHSVEVNTIRDLTNNQTVTAEFTVVEDDQKIPPDFEIFDNLYLQLVVTDNLTEVAGAEADTTRIVITILDENDNSPQFPKDTETVKRSVTENAPDGTVIPSPVATDDDVADVLAYSIASADSNTPDWVTIDSSTGVITVEISGEDKLDCDNPPRASLFYNVTVTDGVHYESVTITVDINDQNDNFPTMEDQTKSIPETPNNDSSSNGNLVLELTPQDADRDAPYNTVYCTFAAATDPQVTSRFRITNNTIFVELAEGVNLDREEADQYSFNLNCYDDPIHQGPNSNPINPPPKVAITLLDINDNLPNIKNTQILGVLDENSSKGTVITLEGEDLDEGDNARINFLEVKEIKRYLDLENPTPEEDTPQDLFIVSTDPNDQQGILTLNVDNLRGFYGFLVLTISLTDFGTTPQTSDVDVTIEVGKYNFEQPQFVFPNTETETQYLQTVQTPGSPLILFDGSSILNNLNASDMQGNKFGVRFQLLDDGGVNIFGINNLGNSQARVVLNTATFETTAYNLTIMAYNDAPENTPGSGFNQNTTLKIDFFDKEVTDPVFTNHADTTGFSENINGLTYQIEKASYSKPDLPPDLPVYYLLREGDSTIFNLNIDTGLITLLKELDYEDVKSYNLLIQSSNSADVNLDAIEATKFNLTVQVTDENDNPPIFDAESKTYVATLVLINSEGTSPVVTQVTATDVDTTAETLRYNITSFSGSTDALNQLTKPFEINNEGIITQNFNGQSDWNGYFTLEVTVHDESDEDDHKDVAQVQIYLVTDQHLVQFTFENDQDDVRSKKDEIKQVLDASFVNPQYDATIEDPTQGTPVNDAPRTVCPIYFVDLESRAPLDKTEIYKKVTDVNFFRSLSRNFLSYGLALQNFDASTTTNDNLEATLKAWLIGVSVVLGALCMILLIAFILKTRTLNQRINKLSNTKFGSQESGLNRTGVAAPTTNKHAIEGSNPVYNNDVDTKDIDRRISVTSGDSDLIGVEDDEKFNYDSPTKEYNIE